MKSRVRAAICWLLLGILQTLIVPGQAKPRVEFTSPCTCEGNHGVSRWAAKTDLTEPPANNIKSITPSQIYEWKGPGGKIPTRGERLSSENQWYSVTGRVERLKVEDDGDVHIELSEPNGKGGWIVVELPLGPRWCEMRKTAFSWTSAHFPIVPGREETIRLHEHPIVTVIGRAFYDIDHAQGGTENNRRNYNQALAVWEIHPVMRLLANANAAAAAPTAVVFNPPPEMSAPSAAPSPPATAVPQSTSGSDQFVTLTKPVTVQIPHGSTVLQPGTKLPVLSRNAQNVDVRYLDARYSVPISSTDLH
jgi:hypothetical protein